MNKNRNLYIALGIIALIVIMVYGSSQGLIKLPFAVSGVNTLSISNVNLQSYFDKLDGKAWLITFSQGQLGQHFFGEFSPDAVESKTSGDLKTTKNFKIAVDYQDTTCNYVIGAGSSIIQSPIYDIDFKEWTCDTSWAIPQTPTEQKAKEKSGLSNILYYGKYGGLSKGSTCFAIGYNTQSIVKSFPAEGDVGGKYNVYIEVPGEPSASVTIDTLAGSGQGSLGNYAYVVYNGNLATGKKCASIFNPIDYKASYVNGQWRIISNNAYLNYKSKLNEGLSEGSTRSLIYSREYNAITTWANQLKSQSQTALISQSVSGSLLNKYYLSNAKLVINTQTPLELPVTSIYIKASTIGIYTPVPDFSITDASSSCFKTGENGIILVNVKNNGEKGGYNIYAKCQNQFSSTWNSQGSLNKGDSATISIPISATTDKKITDTCIINLEQVGKTITKNVNVCVNPQITCTATSPFCSFDGVKEVVKECINEGASSKITDICETGEYCDLGTCKTKSGVCKKEGESAVKESECCKGLVLENGKCVQSTDITKCQSCQDFALSTLVGSVWKSKQCEAKSVISLTPPFISYPQSITTCAVSFFKLLLIPIVFIFALLFGKDLYLKFLQNKEWLAWILSIISAGILAYLVYVMFWIGLIVFIGYVILRIVLSATLGKFKLLKKLK